MFWLIIIAAVVIAVFIYALKRNPPPENAYKLETKPLQPKQHAQEKQKAIASFKIINGRPDGWTFQEYKDYLKKQKAFLKSRRRGWLCYKAAELIQYSHAGKTLTKIRTWQPFKGNTHKLQNL